MLTAVHLRRLPASFHRAQSAAVHEVDARMPLIAAMLGHALVATEDPKNFAEAKQVLKVAVSRDNENPFAWYQLGIIYDREGDQARASLASAERFSLEGNPRQAMQSARTAIAGIKPGTPDCLRAQDIVMAARGELANRKNRRSDDDDRQQGGMFGVKTGGKVADKFSPTDLVCRGA